MPKYIDADEVRKIARERYIEDRLYDLDEYSMLLDFLDTMPAADVVEVVRCKDCKYSESVPKWKDFELGCMLHREYTTATDFCSQAERRERK